MGTPAEDAKQQMQKEAAYEPSAMEMSHGLEWLFKRKDIPSRVKDRFWMWTSIKDLRLSNLIHVDNANVIISHLDYDIHLYLVEKQRKENTKLSEKILSWLNQLKVLVRLNVMASLGQDSRDMNILTKTRFEGKSESEIEQRQRQGEESGGLL